MYFLIVPVTATGTSLPGWSPSPISTIGNSAALLTSTDAMIGLRNRVLALYQKPMAFAVSDPATNTVYKWKPAVGVTSLKTRESGLASLTLGFEIPDLAKEIEWGPTINLNKGTCYWINPLVRGGVRSGNGARVADGAIAPCAMRRDRRVTRRSHRKRSMRRGRHAQSRSFSSPL